MNRSIIFLGNNENTLKSLLDCDVNIIAAIHEKNHPRPHSGCCDAAVRSQGGNVLDVPKDDPAALTEVLKQFDPPDAILVSVFGILKSDVINSPRQGCINIHPSLLPDYKGAHPLQWVLINGEAATGVTFMQVAPAIDAGGIYHQVRLPISDDDTINTLDRRVDEAVRQALPETLDGVLSGRLAPRPQTRPGSYFPKLTPAVRWLNFYAMTARQIHNLIRSQTNYGGGLTTLNQKRLNIPASRILEESSRPQRGGEVLAVNSVANAIIITVQCVQGQVEFKLSDDTSPPLHPGDWLGT